MIRISMRRSSRFAFAVLGVLACSRDSGEPPNRPAMREPLISVSQQDNGSVIRKTVRPADESASGELGVIVRLKGTPLLAAWAQERLLRQTAGQASVHLARARTILADQHGRMRALIESVLHKRLKAGARKSADGDVAYQEFHDAINAIALHGVPASQLGALATHADVAAIEPIQTVTATLLDSVPLMNADDVWAQTDANGAPIDGTGMRIGIIDTGVDYTHPDLGGCFGPGCKVVGGYDFVNTDADPLDDHGHGTHVAATAAGNGTYASSSGPAAIRGVAPNARIYAYKVLNAYGSGTSTAIISAIERCADPNQDGNYADHLDVCSMSLGGYGTPDDSMSIAVDNATANGVLFTVAAGNSGPGPQTISSPGTSRRAITVAAACKPSAVGVDSRCAQAIASFSSRGPVVWTANGVTQTLAKPDVAAYGVNICAAESGTYQSGSRCLDSRHIAISGTSMATPHVAGLAALLRQSHPEWTPDQVKSFIANGAVSLGLDPSIQGAGRVDALNSLNLGGIPSAVARLGGLPLLDVSQPTSRYGTFSSDLTVTNITSSELTYVPSVTNADPGLSISFSTAGIVVPPGQTGVITVTRQVDQDLVPSRTEVRGTVLLSTALGDAKVMVQVAIRDRLQAAPTKVDMGIDLPSQQSWTAQKSVTLQNSRTDAPASYTATVSCCNGTYQFNPAGISATLDQTTVNIPPGGSATLTLTVNVNNAGLLNGRFDGSVTLTSPLQSMSVPVTFFKGYGLSFDFAGQTPLYLALSSATTPSTSYQPTSPSLMLYLTDPGPYFAEASWQGSYYVLKAEIPTDVPVQNVTMDKATAIHRLDFRPIDSSGGAVPRGTSMMRFAHMASGGGMALGSGSTSTQLWFSDLPAGFAFTASFVGKSANGELNAFTYEVPGPITSDVLLTNSPSSLIARDIQVARPGPTGAAYLLPWACLVWPYYSTPNGMSGGGNICSGNLYDSVPAPTTSSVRVNFYSNVTRDLLSPGYPYAPSVQFELDADQNLTQLYHGPNLMVNASRMYAWDTLMPWNGAIEVTDAMSIFACDPPPASTLLPFANGPMVDGWSFHNYRTNVLSLRGGKGLGLMPFRLDGCVQDVLVNAADTSYQLYRNGTLVAGGPIYSTAELRLPASPGQHRFELRRSAVFGGVSTQVESISTFQVSTGATVDENPPALQSLHLLGRGIWQEVLDPGLINRVAFRVSPMPGYSAPNSNWPPEYLMMPDSLASAALEYSADGTNWSPVGVTANAAGEYSSAPLIVDPAVALHWLRISASDAAGNTLRHTFQVPRGKAWAAVGADAIAPSVSITQPTNGKKVNGTVTVGASAFDNVGVTRVQLWIDGALFAEKAAPPFSWDWNTDLVTQGPHQLRARAFDAAENLADSAVVAVTVGPDTTPPTVALTAPAAGATVGAGVQVAADAQDDFSVTKVEFFADGVSFGTSMAPPFTAWWNASAAAEGGHLLSAVATDGSGNTGTSAPVAVTVDHTAPTVAVTAPAEGALVHGAVTVSASASDAIGISRVDFHADGILFATVATAPFTAIWSSGPDGTHSLTAQAFDLAGNSSSSPPLNVTVDNTGPSVAMSAPASGAKVRGTTTLRADASDVSGVDRVEFLVDGTVVGTSSQPPYGYDWASGPDGIHYLSARAYDLLGNSSLSASRSITADNTPPSVSVTAPAAGSWMRGWISLTASAGDAYGLAQVDFLVDGMLVGSDTTAPYSIAWNSTGAAEGIHAVSARATDAAGNQAGSAPVSFNVDNTAPIVGLTAPAANATITGTVVVSADASDANGISRVEFWAGSTFIASDSSAPYSISWDSSGVPNGSYSLMARAYDAAGNTQTSAPVPVTVSNPVAVYDATLRAPKCADVGTRCSSGGLLTGRGPVGPEANAPNTINGSCSDSTYGTFHSDESLDALEISSASGPFAPGVTVTVKATVWAWSNGSSDVLELYYAADATAPAWTLIASMASPGGQAQTLTASYTLPDGASLQAIRGRFRYGGIAGPCGTGSFDDQDDLIFAVGGIVPDTTPPTTAITAPTSGATLSGIATVGANASDNRGVARVEFYAGTSLLGTDTTAPYSVSWNTSTVANGSYVLTSKAYDGAGNSATSAGVSVIVNNFSTDLLSNGGFEGTPAPWVLSGVASHSPSGPPTHGGSGHVYLGNAASTTGSVYQQITIPAGTSPSLTFWLYIATGESSTGTYPYDKLFVEVLNSAGTVLGTLATYSNVNWGPGYIQRGPFSLASYAGQTVRIQFRQTNDSIYPTVFRIDDASVK